VASPSETRGPADPATPSGPAADEAADWVLHVDLDEFLAAVEVQRRPELRDRPVVVGGRGDPTERAVVATASYAARRYGIRSGMPLRTAARLCPDAVFLPSDKPAYEEASARVMDALRSLGMVVEVIGWDEAFVGVRTADPEAVAARIRRTILDATGLVSSVGVGDNKLRAKTATGFAKPAGVARLTRATWAPVMFDRPTEALWGVGGRTARKLRDAGITTIGELARADPADLARRLGPTMGPWYRALAHGAGGTRVSDEPWVPRSRSRETTYQRNLTDRAQIDEQVAVLARRVAVDVRTEGRPARRIGVKVRFAPFFTQTRSMTLPAATSDPGEIERAALVVLDRFDHGRPVRLLGVRAEFEPDGAR
jgi:DNA polymerase IV